MIRVEKKRKQYPCGIVEIIPNVSSLMRCIQHHMGPGPKKHAEREYIKYFSQEECPLHYNPKKYAQLVRESPPKLGIEAYQSISRSVQITKPSQWYSRLINFNESMAAWSVMCWVLDLGDRHCENILVKVNNFTIHHIDFEYIFLRQNLGVPEIVPFRLTPNL
ncbi:hypothetical protein ADUPG1_003956, partial [Aduncisulcus paluster]